MNRVLPLTAALLCGACTTPQSRIDDAIGGRELRPARAGIKVGSLYFARERATDDQSRPFNLEPLCEINLDRYGIVPQTDMAVADIDLSGRLEATGALTGIRNYFAEIGLSGSFSDYFEYKITNVRAQSITLDEAERVFESRAFRRDCKRWTGNITRWNWARYQVLSFKTGDIVFQRKSDAGLSAEVKAKIAVAEPRLKASLKREHALVLSGTNLVFAVSPFIRE